MDRLPVSSELSLCTLCTSVRTYIPPLEEIIILFSMGSWKSGDPLSDFPASPVVSLADIERIAHRSLPRNALDYYRSGADQMHSLGENRSAFLKYEKKKHSVPTSATLLLFFLT